MRNLALILVVLAGCGTEPVADPVPGACGARDLTELIGQPAAVLETMRFGQVVRIIRPGMAVTMDYLESRLNIEIDAAEVIVAVSCG